MIGRQGPLWPDLGIVIQRNGAASTALTTAELDEFATGWRRHRVLLIRNFPPAPSQQLRLTAAIGQIVGRKPLGPGQPVRPELRWEHDRRPNPYNTLWHVDTSWAAVPADVTLLYAEDIEAGAAPTELADTLAGLAGMTGERRAQARGWYAFHHVAASRRTRHLHLRSPSPPGSPRQRPSLATRLANRLRWVRHRRERGSYPARTPIYVDPPGARHRVIGVDPASGREYAYLGEHAWSIEGMDSEASVREIESLTAAVARRTYQHAWQTQDLLVFDNRTFMHRHAPTASPSSGRRVLRRTLAWRHT